MAERAFPVIYAARVSECAAFYEALGFTRRFRLPPEGEPGYIGLQRGTAELAVVSTVWPQEQYGVEPGERPRFEMFVYVEDVDATVAALRERGTRVLREPADMSWGERVAFVADPEGNPVALARGPL
jgi:lactoylglutathione lyase